MRREPNLQRSIFNPLLPTVVTSWTSILKCFKFQWGNCHDVNGRGFKLRQIKLSEVMQILELAIQALLGSIEDEGKFIPLSFVKNKQCNCLPTYLPLVVGIDAHQFFGFDNFPYSAAHDDRRKSVQKKDLEFLQETWPMLTLVLHCGYL